jgi:valyl-tRNA synthetase
VIVPLAGLVDNAAEKVKLEKQRDKLGRDRDHLRKKLDDPNFTSRAPLEILDKDRARLAELEAGLARIELALGRLKD